MNRKMMAALLLTSALTTTAQTEPIRIDLGQKGAVVSPNLYGIFFEEINHAGDGGLYAELVQNRGFEEHVLPSGMTYRDGKAYAPDASRSMAVPPTTYSRWPPRIAPPIIYM